MYVTEALIVTPNGARYAAQLGKHWAHNLQVEESGSQRRITFPRDARGANWPGEGVVTFDPREDGLHCRIDASAPGQRDGLKDAVARHLDRFAFREGPLTYAWRNTPAAGE